MTVAVLIVTTSAVAMAATATITATMTAMATMRLATAQWLHLTTTLQLSRVDFAITAVAAAVAVTFRLLETTLQDCAIMTIITLLHGGEVEGDVASLRLQLAVHKTLISYHGGNLQQLVGVGKTVLGHFHFHLAHLHERILVHTT